MANANHYPAMLAGGITEEDSFTPFHLWAGESDIVSDQITAGATALEQFRVYMDDGTGKKVPWDGTAGKAEGFTAQPIAANSEGPSFVGGIANHAALVWPLAVDTLEERKAAFSRTNLGVRKLL